MTSTPASHPAILTGSTVLVCDDEALALTEHRPVRPSFVVDLTEIKDEMAALAAFAAAAGYDWPAGARVRARADGRWTAFTDSRWTGWTDVTRPAAGASTPRTATGFSHRDLAVVHDAVVMPVRPAWGTPTGGN
jgi:hypothetical protein